MHDHATDGGIAAYHDKASARDIRLHLDNAHGLMTTGWTHAQLVERHDELHHGYLSEGLAAAPPAVAESVVAEGTLYLTDATGIVYLAEPVVGARPHVPVYTLTEQEPPAERVVDLSEATKASLAATHAYLDAHKEGAT